MAEVNKENLEKELRSLIAEIIEMEEGKITPDANFVKDLGMDSMMALEILAATEKKYKIQIPEQKLAKLTSLKEVVNVAVEYLSKK
jgi:acyl carrier protein